MHSSTQSERNRSKTPRVARRGRRGSGGVRRHQARTLSLSELPQPRLQRQAVECFDRQGAEQLHARFDRVVDVGEDLAPLRIRAFGGGGIGKAPMRGDRLARPDRAHLAGGVVADGDDEIHLRRIARREVVPALAQQVFGRQVDAAQQVERQRVDVALRMAAGAVAAELALAPVVEKHFRHDAARRIAGAEEQDIACAVAIGAPVLGFRRRGARGRRAPSARGGRRRAAMAGGHSSGRPPQQLSVRKSTSACIASKSAL